MELITCSKSSNSLSLIVNKLIRVAGITLFLLDIHLSGQSHSYAEDVFVTAGPVKGSVVQSLTEVPSNSYSVSTRTDAAQCSFPIAVPLGRQGMQPSLVLTYSSQNPLGGGVEAGWLLNAPSIRVDSSSGRLAQIYYKSTLAGGHQLVRVNEPGAKPGGEKFLAEQDLVERVTEERLDPVVRLLELKRYSSDVLIGHITSYEFRELGKRKSHPYHQFVIFHVKPENHLKGTIDKEIQLWIEGVQGPTGPVLVSENPQPKVGEKAVLFLKYESMLEKEAYIPASDEWSYLPIQDKTNVVLPTGHTFHLGEITNMMKREVVP